MPDRAGKALVLANQSEYSAPPSRFHHCGYSSMGAAGMVHEPTAQQTFGPCSAAVTQRKRCPNGGMRRATVKMGWQKESPVASAGLDLKHRFRHWRYDPPLKTSAFVMAFVLVLTVALVFLQYHGDFLRRTRLTVMASRAGLLMEPGSKVTYNGIQIGRVGTVDAVEIGGKPRARLTLDVIPRYLALMPRNVDATISATTVFGNKYISFTSPKNPSPQRITSADTIDVTSVTTEFNTLFETVVDVAQQVDPIKLNQTLSATAQALNGLGDRFGQSIVQGNEILSEIN